MNDNINCRVLDSRPRGRRFEPHWRHCIVSLSKNIIPSLVLVQPRKTRHFVTERLLLGSKESNINWHNLIAEWKTLWPTIVLEPYPKVPYDLFTYLGTCILVESKNANKIIEG